MKRIGSFEAVLAVLLVLGCAGYAQQFKFPPDLERLAAKASEVVDVNMDRRMLDFASRFMDADDDVEAKALIKNLKGVYVKSFEFERPGEYTQADVELFRAQLRGPQWSKVVEARSKRDGENVEIYFRLENGASQGLAIISAGAKELTLVNIDGPIDPQQLSLLDGQFGIPPVEIKRPAQKANGDTAKTTQAVKK
jgi:Domain of unknown function (DUF4252)